MAFTVLKKSRMIRWRLHNDKIYWKKSCCDARIDVEPKKPPNHDKWARGDQDRKGFNNAEHEDYLVQRTLYIALNAAIKLQPPNYQAGFVPYEILVIEQEYKEAQKMLKDYIFNGTIKLKQ